jgi:hypothetical protein
LAWLLAALSLGCLWAPSRRAEEPPAPVAVVRPDWTVRPVEVGAVGKCDPSPLPGKQEELAQQSALAQIALQQDGAVVNVESVVVKRQTDHMSVGLSDSRVEATIQGKTVRARIKDYWRDPQTGTYFVWMVPGDG